MKTVVYVDGFNLYHSLKNSKGLKWLNLDTLSVKLLPKSHILFMRYFTAQVTPRPSDPSQPQRQDIYLRALRTLPSIVIHYGIFKSNVIKRPLKGQEESFVKVVDPREKRSDVSLATHLVHDAHRGLFDWAAVITNDSDFTHAIEVVTFDLRKHVVVLCPVKHISPSLKEVATESRRIRRALIKKCQFPDELVDEDGRTIRKPATW